MTSYIYISQINLLLFSYPAQILHFSRFILINCDLFVFVFASLTILWVLHQEKCLLYFCIQWNVGGEWSSVTEFQNDLKLVLAPYFTSFSSFWSYVMASITFIFAFKEPHWIFHEQLNPRFWKTPVAGNQPPLDSGWFLTICPILLRNLGLQTLQLPLKRGEARIT